MACMTTTQHRTVTQRWSTRIGAGLALGLTVGLLAALPASARATVPVVGAPTSGDSLFPNVGNGGYDVGHYDIDLAWDVDNTIEATTTITAEAPAPLSSYSLDFEGLTVDSITVNGTPATWARDVDAAAIKYKLIVTPAQPVSGEFTTVVTYSGTPVTHVDPDDSSEGWVPTSDGATFVNQPVGSMTGFPNNNTPSDKATYSIALDVPTDSSGPLSAVSNGELTSRTVAGDRTTWTWTQDEPMASELSLISIGHYDVTEGQISLASGRTIPEWSFVDSGISSTNKAAIEVQRLRLKTILDFLETKYGPYPGNSTGIVVDVTSLGYALETQDRPYFEGRVSSGTLVHELTHQWFGDSVAPKDWNDIWLNEGPASYVPTLFNYETGASTRSPKAIFRNMWSSTPGITGLWDIPPAAMTDPADIFGWQVYSRGAMTLAALSTEIGNRDFNALMAQWLSRNSGTSRSTADFIALAEELSGQDLTAFFQDWLYDADKPAWPGVRVFGRPAVGVKLAALTTGWPSGTRFDYQWLRGTKKIAGATSRTYRVVATDRGAKLRVMVIGTSATATSTRTSAATAVVAAGQLTRTPRPRISGTVKVGKRLVARPGSWDLGVVLTYRWLVDGSPVRGATSKAFTIRRKDRGDRVRVVVTGRKHGYVGVARTSAATRPVR